MVPSGPHLAYWDSKDQALVNARGMQVGCPVITCGRSFGVRLLMRHISK